jgi:NAD(P)-dependent dehydrogenase (short-subunit alcohol dehydrogenase family)
LYKKYRQGVDIIEPQLSSGSVVDRKQDERREVKMATIMKWPSQGPKHWVVTGASRGIGLEMVSQLLRAHEKVTVIARGLAANDTLQGLKRDFPAQLHLLQADVTSDDEVRRAAEALVGQNVDVLVNNAGILRESAAPLSELDLQLITEQLLVNALAPVRVTRALLPMLLKAERPIVANITSKMGSIAEASKAAYGYRMSKAALNMFSKCLAAELPHGISLSLHPGWVKTEMGGAEAPVEIPDSASGLLTVIRSAQPEQSGKFFDFRGSAISW